MNPEKFYIRPQFRKISVSVNCNLIFIPLPYFFLLKLFIAIVLSGIITPSLQLPSCRKVFLPPRKTLKRLRQNFMFVETTFFGTPRQRTRYVDAQRSGNSICPWRWVHDDNPNRVPRFLTKAVLPCNTVFPQGPGAEVWRQNRGSSVAMDRGWTSGGIHLWSLNWQKKKFRQWRIRQLWWNSSFKVKF